MKRLFFTAFAIILVLTCACCFSGCSKSIMTDEAFSYCMSEIFDKPANRITQDDLNKIETLQVITYSKTNELTVAFEGYRDFCNSEAFNYADAEKYLKTVDITGHTFENTQDFALLTNLLEFHSIYSGFQDFSFLESCTKLDTFNATANYECQDYSSLGKVLSLKKLTITDAIVNDTSFIGNLTSLEYLNLSSTRNGDYNIQDLSFLSSLKNLKELNLSSNTIYEIDALAELDSLETLILSFNGIEDVSPLANLKNLKYIDLTQNLVSDLSSLTNLDAENFDIIILDLNSLIKDWSPLDYLGNKVQGRPSGYVISNTNTSSQAADNNTNQEQADNTQEELVADDSQLDEEYGDNDFDVSIFDDLDF